MTVAAVSLLAQLAVQLADELVFTPLVQELWEKAGRKVSVPGLAG